MAMGRWRSQDKFGFCWGTLFRGYRAKFGERRKEDVLPGGYHLEVTFGTFSKHFQENLNMRTRALPRRPPSGMKSYFENSSRIIFHFHNLGVISLTSVFISFQCPIFTDVIQLVDIVFGRICALGARLHFVMTCCSYPMQ